MKTIRKFKENDLELLMSFKNDNTEKKLWTLERVKRELMDFGRGYGENVLIEEDNGAISAFAGFVKTTPEKGEFFISPFVLKSSKNCLLMERLIKIAKENNAKWIRSSVFCEEAEKKKIFCDYQFYNAFEFITLQCDLGEIKLNDVTSSIVLIKIPREKLDPEKFAELNNSAFKNVQNAAIINKQQANDTFNSFYRYGELSQIWSDEFGTYVGFVEVTSDGYIEAIATNPKFQKRGVGKFMLSELLKVAKGESFTNIKSIISSENTSSLALHRSLGFREIERREVMQLDLE
ncbi:MAG: hypothetical protein A2381_00210 [Bdellovibrionales bacterium RIFOXYB1_FULL_37_110]|nr:MAG: hypothetical protein A2417_11265 [Bdellovibrionales bacterium RIFOXYC1_FULL_37_79]OFZ60817.1 MAG: hypothetical protein A2381_00210 [Bdellovibrionales bacterium RIFOXYB1_FULL_37_110]OFZ62347.1 MAG: hypothetical protein A2577_02875 [Bdellovibrionales bacterium RIFOXYD1_FULL_36_51]